MDGNEAVAIAALLQFADMLQFNLKTAIKEDADWSTRFMPLTKVVNEASGYDLKTLLYSIILCDFLFKP